MSKSKAASIVAASIVAASHPAVMHSDQEVRPNTFSMMICGCRDLETRWSPQPSKLGTESHRKQEAAEATDSA